MYDTTLVMTVTGACGKRGWFSTGTWLRPSSSQTSSASLSRRWSV